MKNLGETKKQVCEQVEEMIFISFCSLQNLRVVTPIEHILSVDQSELENEHCSYQNGGKG